MLVAPVSALISLLLGVMLAYPLARMRFPAAGLLAISVAVAYLVPQTLLFVPMADLINRMKLGDSLSAVMLTYPTLLVPFCAWLLIGYFKTVPRELEEAALIDGASRWRAMTRVILPLCTPGFLSAGIFAFTLAQNEFLYALLFLNTSTIRTVPVGVTGERSEEHTSELQSQSNLVCRLLLEKKKVAAPTLNDEHMLSRL